MDINEIECNIGSCGLICALCSYKTGCSGCQSNLDCEVKACSMSKGYSHCYKCPEWPCDRDIHKGLRTRAFNEAAKNEGLTRLAEYLYTNLNRGITYHREDKLTGDYDRCKTKDEVIELLKYGKPDPYDICPVYESKNFILRLVSADDTEDLLECYSNEEAQRLFNSDNCTSDFKYSTREEMLFCIDFWLKEYSRRAFVRFSLIDKLSHKAVGTIEIFDGDIRFKKGSYAVLRLDILPQYEYEAYLAELVHIADTFFYDFKFESVITKAIPEAEERIKALSSCGYFKWLRKDFFIKNKQ